MESSNLYPFLVSLFGHAYQKDTIAKNKSFVESLTFFLFLCHCIGLNENVSKVTKIINFLVMFQDIFSNLKKKIDAKN
jgi:hypothetical protein